MTREEAIAILEEEAEFLYQDDRPYNREAFDMAIEALKDRPHGEWKQTITWQPYCSNCEYVFDEDEEYSPLWKFCPMCGAEMADNSLFNDITESPNDVVESKDDVIEVVRCKDCRYSRVYQTDSKGTMQTYCVAFIMSRTVTDDDFCSWGERREP